MKTLKNTLNNLTGKCEWLLPIIEVLTFSPLLLSFCDNQHLILYLHNSYLSSFGKIVLETAIIKNSIALFVVAFACFAAKIVAAFFMMKKSKWGYFATILLYIIDFIASLVMVFTCETTLQEYNTTDLFFCVVSLFMTPCISCLYLYLYFGLIRHKKKSKEFKIFSSIVFSVAIIALVVVWFDGNKKIASENEVATLDRCYEYSEKYLYEALPKDEETLEKMQNDIEDVFSKELFFTAFNQSKYFARLKEEQKSEIESPIQLKSVYANELMYLKCKILLKLDKNEEYIDYYIETRRWFSTAEVEFFYKYLEKDIKNYSDDDCEIIKKACVEFMKADVNRVEKLWASIDYSAAAGKDLTKKERQEIAKQIQNELLPDYTIEQIKEDLIKAEKYEVRKRSLYMLK